MPSENKAAAPHRREKSRWFGGRWLFTGILIFSLLASASVTYLLYGAMQRVFRSALDERLQVVASIAALHFDPAELARNEGAESVGTAAYEQAVLTLQRIRAQTQNIHYAYILRRTADPATMEFVADADSLHPDQPVDLNGDGAIDEEDALTYPGDPYDVSEFPEFQEAAFVRPFVDPEFTVSQWGLFLAGTAPIREPADPTAPTDYVLGLDLDVTQYQRLLQQVFIPFIAFTVFLLLVISLQALALRRFWKRQVQQLAEIDRQKDELLGIVSHQLGGPITSLRWSLEGLQDGDLGKLSKEQSEEVSKMQLSAGGLADLVGLLLDLSRIELGRLVVEKHEVELRPFLEELLQGIEVLAREKSVTLDIDLSKNLPKVRIDRRLTRMTLENLLNNAVKYTPEQGQVTFIVRVVDGKLHCRISDTGCGIPAMDLPQLFTKLYRASNVRDTVPGNGFGLYIAKGAIEQQGGTIRCQSTLGQGTTFDVELPLQ